MEIAECVRLVSKQLGNELRVGKTGECQGAEDHISQASDSTLPLKTVARLWFPISQSARQSASPEWRVFQSEHVQSLLQVDRRLTYMRASYCPKRS